MNSAELKTELARLEAILAVCGDDEYEIVSGAVCDIKKAIKSDNEKW